MFRGSVGLLQGNREELRRSDELSNVKMRWLHDYKPASLKRDPTSSLIAFWRSEQNL